MNSPRSGYSKLSFDKVMRNMTAVQRVTECIYICYIRDNKSIVSATSRLVLMNGVVDKYSGP